MGCTSPTPHEKVIYTHMRRQLREDGYEVTQVFNDDEERHLDASIWASRELCAKMVNCSDHYQPMAKI